MTLRDEEFNQLIHNKLYYYRGLLETIEIMEYFDN